MRQGAAEPIQFPHDQLIAGCEIFEAGPQARPVLASAGCLVGIEMPAIDAGCDQRIALKIDRLPVICGRDAHVAYKHVGKPLIACCGTVLLSGRVYRTLRILGVRRLLEFPGGCLLAAECVVGRIRRGAYRVISIRLICSCSRCRSGPSSGRDDQ